jgi:putative phage-type endonuclease
MVAALQDEHLIQGTEAWKEWRKEKIGASDAPCIMGVGFHTPYQLWEFKTGISEPVVNQAMSRGTIMEEEARQAFIRETGIEVEPLVVVDPEYPLMIASLDGMSYEGDLIVEIKCPGIEDHVKALSGEIPEKYYPQLQHQMEVTGLDEIRYYSWTSKSSKIILVKRDQNYIENKLMPKLIEFYDCMRFFTPPKQSDKDFIERSDTEWAKLSLAYQDIKARLEYYEKQEEILKEQLVLMANEKNSIGSGIKLSKVIRKGNVDYSKIPELQDVDLEVYRKEPIQSWRVTFQA